MERRKVKTIPINNAFYDDLNEKWHTSKDHPVALLRAENELRNPWINRIINEKIATLCKILDVGCGGGFLTNYLALKAHEVHGVDLSEKSLEIARKKDTTQSVCYLRASAYDLPYKDGSFDVICAMDLLEHVEKPAIVIKEAARLLKKNGLFFFHTFNRNIMSYFMVIKGVEWCFFNPPDRMHVYPLFLKPQELSEMCENVGLRVEQFLGVRPDFKHSAFWKMLLTRKVEPDFQFTFTPSLATGYSGYAIKVL
ncbi:MAG: bifunctional 2-polyprenyl-6-hydroxyphenol methylase/3-demethylubiquinol 3-O-methyltransferase UbiG [Chlamydiae bacterium]|nr:bifunctional 2-polyprenyl-6-hydroxyphenol methylase/3-demethylubiquinol 3-O-methyltransferase UbiG [Chlamydiota bacterium]